MTETRAKYLLFEMIRDSYPEIRIWSVKVKFVKKQDYYMACQWRLFFTLLFIDKSALKFSESAFKGCLSHELSHILQNKNLLLKLLTANSSVISERDEERAADAIAVQRGYGKDLIQFHKEHNKTRKPFKASEGLTKQEIAALLGSQNT